MKLRLPHSLLSLSTFPFSVLLACLVCHKPITLRALLCASVAESIDIIYDFSIESLCLGPFENTALYFLGQRTTTSTACGCNFQVWLRAPMCGQTNSHRSGRKKDGKRPAHSAHRFQFTLQFSFPLQPPPSIFHPFEETVNYVMVMEVAESVKFRILLLQL